MNPGAHGRIAFLWTLREDTARPIGCARERENGVEVVLPKDEGIPAFHDKPYNVLDDKTMRRVNVAPGEPRYFDEVVCDLSKCFAVSVYGTPLGVVG